MWCDGLTVDFAHPEADLSGYRLVVAPSSYLLTTTATANLRRYVSSGGTVVMSYFSAIVDEHDAVHAGGLGAPLRDVLGVTVEEFLPLLPGDTVQLEGGIVGDTWTDAIRLEGAGVVTRYVDGPAAGGPAITRHVCGAGVAWYVSTRLDVAGLTPVLSSVYADAGLSRARRPAELEVVTRGGEDADYVVAVNHATTPVRLPVTGTDLLGGRWGEQHEVPAGGVVVARVPHATPSISRVPGRLTDPAARPSSPS